MPSHLPSLGRIGSTHSDSKGKFQLKIVVLGSPRVGKSAIINQFLYSHFPETYTATIDQLHRAEYEVKGFGSLVLDILDTSGSHEFPVMKKLAIESGDAFLLVFSLTDSDSFEEVRQLREEIIATKSCRAAKLAKSTEATAEVESLNNIGQYSPNYTTQLNPGYNYLTDMNDNNKHSSSILGDDYIDFSYVKNSRHNSINLVSNDRYSYEPYYQYCHKNPDTKLDNIDENCFKRKYSDHRTSAFNIGHYNEKRLEHEPSLDYYHEPIKSPPIVVAGNKFDLDSMRVIKKELAETIVSIDWENGYVETSAKDDYNITALFQQLMVQIGVPYKVGNAIGNPKMRRKSLPAYPTSPAIRDKITPKRNSCAVS